MRYKGLLQTFLIAVLGFKLVQTQDASCICRPTTIAGSEFEFTFRYLRGGLTQVTGLKSYNVSRSPQFDTVASGSGCSTADVQSDILTIGYAVDTDTDLPCGIEQDAVTTSKYNVAIGLVGLSKIYTFTCDTNDLLETEVKLTSFGTGHVNDTAKFSFEQEVQFRVVTPGDPPDERSVTSAFMGEPIKLQLTYENTRITETETTSTEEEAKVRDHLGKIFHTGLVLGTVDIWWLEIYTLSDTGSNVTITGPEGIQMVHVEKELPEVITMPVDIYAQPDDRSNWNVNNTGIKIESLGQDIGVTLRTLAISMAETALLVHPDDILGDSYRLAFFDEDDNAKAAIIGTVDNTDVVFNLSQYSQKTADDLKIQGVSVKDLDTHTVTINEGEKIEIECISCSNITIHSSDKVAVIMGRDTVSLSAGASTGVAQLPASENLYQRFIAHDTSYKNPPRPRVSYFVADQYNTDLNLVTSSASLSMTDNYLNVGTDGSVMNFSAPVYGHHEVFGIGALATTIASLQAIDQWNTNYHFYIRETTTLTFILAAQVGNLDKVTMNGVALGTMSGLNTNDIDPLTTSPGAPGYETYTFEIIVDGSTYSEGWYEFSSNTTGEPFGIHAIERGPNLNGVRSAALLPFGMLYPCVDAAGTINVTCGAPTATTSAVQERQQIDVAGILVTDLFVSDTPSFSSPVTVHEDGCNIYNTSSILSTIGPFTKNAAFTDRLVLETSVFRAFRIRSSPLGYGYLYFRVVYELCPHGAETCANSCHTRKKRSERSRHVDLRIKITDKANTTESGNAGGQNRPACDGNIVYWMPHVMLLLIIFVEAVTTGCMLVKKMKLKHR